MLKKRLMTTICLAAILTAMPTAAQTYYDLTDSYLRNADFSANINYAADATGDVTNIVADIDGWALTSASKKQLAVGATFQYGTQATFYGVPIPATGPEGNAQGGCLTLCASFLNELTFCQRTKLPAGNYLMLITWKNCNSEAETGRSQSGWWVSKDDNALSARDHFAYGEWTTDTVSFSLSEATQGQLQVGFKSTKLLPPADAMLAIDHVRLLRDHPYDDEDDRMLSPVVNTDTRFARGATMAFGRIRSVQGENIESQGFCWATHPDPTVADNHDAEIINQAGTIYVMKNLQPATIYYMRAYAMTNSGRVGYGNTIKFCTLPMGNVTYWYNNGGPADANDRVNAAATNACEIFCNLTSIKKHFSIGYSAGTPTADCYYDDEPWMNMGANASYQRTGTIMHEMEHGMGVISYTTQWAGNIMRSGNGTGQWLGDRVSAFLDFWDNTTGSRLNGDTQHMWPYGINGAHEDHNNIADYYANAMIGQALGEDGLEHRYSTFAEPYYSFIQEDTIKYYLTPEDANRGKFETYLMPTSNGLLRHRHITSQQAIENDSAAWYITFTPKNQYYQLRNAATGQYITYSGSFKTASHASVTTNDCLQLMRGRNNVATANGTARGYWMIHPTGNWTPTAMTAGAGELVNGTNFDLRNTASQQRWLILTATELVDADPTAVSSPIAEQPSEAQHQQGIFTIGGQRVDSHRQQLRPGLYIINGRKTIIR